MNVSEDGRVIALPDDFASQVLWSLVFEGLTDTETSTLTSFFESCEGPLQEFLFLDPTENLLAYSEDFTQPAWQLNSLLSLMTQIDDPLGTNRASRLINNSLGVLHLTQTVNIPGSVYCSFSSYLRSHNSGFQMVRDNGSNNVPYSITPNSSWQRFSLNNAYTPNASASCDFSVSIPPGATLDLFGLQLDAQPFPGPYVVTTSETGIYPSARFNSSELKVTGTGPGQSSARLSIISKASR